MTESLSSLWKQCVAALSATLPRHHVDTWIKPIKPKSLDHGRLTAEVPSAFFKEWIAHHHQARIEAVLKDLTGSALVLELIASPVRHDGQSPIFHQPQVVPKSGGAPTPKAEEAGFSAEEPPLYTFDTFVVGASNRFAHAACLAVADRPGRSYNPLLIYGGSGLGKTHLLRATGHHILSHSPQTRVLYLTCEGFMNEMIAAIRAGNDRMIGFRKKFRQADVLLLDDVQFLEGKESTQEELFHTFNELYDAHHQIVVSSDTHPKHLSLEGRLRSRFEMGLIADIQPPDYETRMAILLKQKDREGVDVPEALLRHLATHITSNIRQLEGSLIRLVAIATLTGRPLTLELAQEVVQDLTGEARVNPLTLDRIKKTVAEYFHISPVDLLSKKRTRAIATARHMALYLARELTKASLPEIGRAFGGRDHTTVLHAYHVVKSRLSTDSSTARHLQELMERLQPGRTP